MNCPRCRNELEEVQTELGLVQMCMSCYGHASPVRFLERLITSDQWQKLLSLSTSVKGRSFKCPQCNHYHQRRRFHFPETYIDLDICQHCSLIWFDRDEIEHFPIQNRKKLGDHATTLIQDRGPLIDADAKAQYLLANLKLEQMARRARNKAKYWNLRRMINTPWMLDAVVQDLLDYTGLDDRVD